MGRSPSIGSGDAAVSGAPEASPHDEERQVVDPSASPRQPERLSGLPAPSGANLRQIARYLPDDNASAAHLTDGKDPNGWDSVISLAGVNRFARAKVADEKTAVWIAKSVGWTQTVEQLERLTLRTGKIRNLQLRSRGSRIPDHKSSRWRAGCTCTGPCIGRSSHCPSTISPASRTRPRNPRPSSELRAVHVLETVRAVRATAR
jgi:hypothetical protein